MLPTARHVSYSRLVQYTTPNDKEGPVLMYFYSPVCGPCHRAVPILEKHYDAVQRHDDLQRLGVRCRAYDTMRKTTDLIEFTPSLHLYNKGKLVHDLTDTFRVVSSDELLLMIRKALSWTGTGDPTALDNNDAEKMWRDLLTQQEQLRRQSIQDAYEARSQKP